MANKKAVLVAVGKYDPHATELTAPVKEMEEWKKLLMAKPYEFAQSDIVLLPDEKATRKAVLNALGALLSGASPGDQLVFVHLGHGSRARGWETEDQLNDRLEEALIVYPNGDSNLQNAAITESDIRRLLREHKPPLGTRITFVVDACLAAGFQDFPFKIFGAAAESELAPDAVLLYAPSPVPMPALKGLQQVRRFGRSRPQDIGAEVERPIVIAAAEADGPAYEVRDNGGRRMLFTKRVIERLSVSHDTYAQLITNITPLHPQIPQVPTLAGNRDRENELFPGAEPQNSRETPTQPSDSRASSVAHAEVETPNFIQLRIVGLCCFVKSPHPRIDGYQSRIVAPLDDRGEKEDKHFAFLEISSDDIIGSPVGAGPTKKYSRVPGGVEYWRWELNGHTVSIENGDNAALFTPSGACLQYVPIMRDLAPELREYPDGACFTATPSPDRFTSFLNLPGGTVTTGPLRTAKTIFQRGSGQITRQAEQTPIAVHVKAFVTGNDATIVIARHQGDARETVVRVRLGSSLFAGNAREKDITGDGSGNVPKEQFLVMYKLSHFTPSDPPLPILTAVPVDACSVSSWP